MPNIFWQGQAIPLAPEESVLDALLRAGHSIPHSCKSGICQSCLLQALPGQAPPAAQSGLKPTLAQQGYFLPCICKPEQDLHLSPPSSASRIPAQITELTLLSPSVLQVRLVPNEPILHRAGQYLTLFRDAQLARAYSIASLPQDPFIELHVRLLPNGQMSSWLASTAAVGQQVFLQGPAGSCHYTAESPLQPLLLAGTGTGLAPLYGILRDALLHAHQGPIHLFQGARNEANLYLQPELAALASQHPNFHYHPAPLDSHGPLPQYMLQQFPQLKSWRGFFCGGANTVSQLKKRCFLAGMASRDIYADAFLAPPITA